MHNIIRFLVIVALAAAFTAEAAKVYKWVDSEGKVHFGDRPPPAEEAQGPIEQQYYDADANTTESTPTGQNGRSAEGATGSAERPVAGTGSPQTPESGAPEGGLDFGGGDGGAGGDGGGGAGGAGAEGSAGGSDQGTAPETADATPQAEGGPDGAPAAPEEAAPGETSPSDGAGQDATAATSQPSGTDGAGDGAAPSNEASSTTSAGGGATASRSTATADGASGSTTPTPARQDSGDEGSSTATSSDSSVAETAASPTPAPQRPTEPTNDDTPAPTKKDAVAEGSSGSDTKDAKDTPVTSSKYLTSTGTDESSPPPYEPKEEFVVMDFENDVLRDEAWLSTQPDGTYGYIVLPKSDSGSDNLYLGKGQGRNGGNALVVEAADESQGLPGFWVVPTYARNGARQNPNDANGYILPRDKRANRMEFWLRFQPGYRANSAAAQPPKYPNHQNMHFGTYHYDPARIGEHQKVQETNGWHFYHQIWLRHDKANDGWIHVVLNRMPQHKRGYKGSPAPNPTAPHGDYWELLTRFYIDAIHYFTDPEIDYPVKMWVDEIKLTYVDFTPDVTVNFPSHETGETLRAYRNQRNEVPFVLTNRRQYPVCGYIGTQQPDRSAWASVIGPLDGKEQPIKWGDKVCLKPLATYHLTINVRPRPKTEFGDTIWAGVTFVPMSQNRSSKSSSMPSLTEANVEKRWNATTGPHDGLVGSDFVRMRVE